MPRPVVTRSRFALARVKRPIVKQPTNLSHYEEVINVTKELRDLKTKFENDLKVVIARAENKIKAISKGDKGDKGDTGKKGDSPSPTQLKEIIKPLIPAPIKGDQGERGLPGKDANEKFIITSVLQQLISKIPTVPQLVAAVIEALKGKLKITDIKNLDETLRHLSSKIMLGGAAGGGMGNIVPFSFTGDGVTTEFTLSVAPTQNGLALIAHYQGQYLHTGQHFTISGRTITFTFVPDNGTLIEGFLIT